MTPIARIGLRRTVSLPQRVLAAVVVVVATSREADAVDSRLRRFGRFEREVGVGAPDSTARAALLERHLPARRSEAIDVDGVAQKCPGWAGADIIQLANAAGAGCVKKTFAS